MMASAAHVQEVLRDAQAGDDGGAWLARKLSRCLGIPLSTCLSGRVVTFWGSYFLV